MLTTAFLLATCAIAAATAGGWNQRARNQILKIHNDYRRKEGGCQMNQLEYDMSLEAQAKKWALGCNFQHEMKKNRGENLAFNTARKSQSQLMIQSAKGWFDEKKDYRPGQHGCHRSCHYTQLVWHSTQKVGCYSYRCPHLRSTSAKNAWYIVCFYTPMGNWVGEEPYKTRCDSPCLPGQTPKNGLCVGAASGAGAGGAACEDSNGNCAAWAQRGECRNNPDYMLTSCKKACKQC